MITPQQYLEMCKPPLRQQALAEIREYIDRTIVGGKTSSTTFGNGAERAVQVPLPARTLPKMPEWSLAEIDAVCEEYHAAGWGVRRSHDLLVELFISTPHP